MKKPLIYSLDQMGSIDKSQIPKHIAFIPDGNRRWARKKLANIIQGHRQGADTLMEIVKASKELGVKSVTFYTFSTENWARPTTEVKAFFQLLQSYLKSQSQEMVENGVRLHTIGDPSKLSKGTISVLDSVKKATAHCQDIDLILAINYGSRDEMRRAIHSIIEDYSKEKLTKEEITEAKISHYLDTSKWPDPELYIRTSGESRVSNFLLWQISYSEIYVANVLWPDFTPLHLLDAILSFQKRARRWGGGT
jgi:undecaprenyl diphosphate synthase